MPASRWQTGLNELLQWNDEEETEEGYPFHDRGGVVFPYDRLFYNMP